MSSGDLLADRRYSYAATAFREGDHDTAADLARQTLELAPGYGPAWFLLGEAAAARQDGDAAADAFRRALAADLADPQGARLRLAALGIGDPLAAMSPGYVRTLFDDYAIRFDRHLTSSLKYRGPTLLHDAVRRACSLRPRPPRFEAALDLGCGTGLAGELFRPECRHLAGIDLSPAMVERARRKRIYDDLATGDLVAWLATRPAASADLALAADVFVYMGDLRPACAAVARTLRQDGLFAFTVQAHPGDGVALGEDLRYAHAERYLCEVAAESGFDVAVLETVSTREDRGEPVPGLLLVLAR